MNAYDPRKGELKSLRYVVRYLTPYRWSVLAALVALLFTSSSVLAFGKALQYLVDEGLGKGNPHLLDNAFMILLGVTALLALATYTRFYVVSWVGEKVVADIRNDIYRHIIRLDVAFFEMTRTGDLLSRLTTDTTLLQNVVGSSVSIALRNMLMLLGGTIMLFVTSPKLASYVFLVLPLVVGPIIVLGRRVRGLSRNTQTRVAEISAHAEETFSGIRTIQSLSLEEYESHRFDNFVAIAFDAATQRIRMRAVLTALVIALVFGAIVTVLWIGGRDVLAGTITTGELSSFVFYSVVVAAAVGGISEVLGELQRSAGATERLVELRNIQPVITMPPSAKELPATLRGDVVLENVSFSYPAHPEKRVLQHYTLHVPPGETIALVGPSGAGKTTVFQLLLRFYDPEFGRVMLDGIDIRDVSPAELRSHIGFVPQDPLIFSANAWENIRAGKLNASDEEVIHAAQLSASLEFLQKLPEGFDTYLGEKGVRLSGGQRQRIAIARAMVRNPRLLLLDEATSALDSENELLVQQAIEKLMVGRTTIVIAHRLSTVLKADRIIVMNNGGIEAIGKHKELLEKSPLYARVAALQFSANIQ